MSKHRRLAKSGSTKQLLKTLSNSPALPAFIQALQTPVLHKLIERVGLRDAGELIALTTPEQMRGMFETSLWETLIPGEAERLRPEKFIEWLDVMLEIGRSFTAQRLIELGETLVALNLAPFITVIDRSVASEHQDDGCFCVLCVLSRQDTSFEIINEYIVVGLHEDEWDTVKTVLVELDGEDAGFLGRVLAHCSTAPTMRDFIGDVHADALLNDETYERAQRRSRGGFVTPPLAATFLKSARRAQLDELVSQTHYDDISQRYFGQLAASEAPRPGQGRVPAASSDDAEALSPTPLQLRQLEGALIDAGIVSGQQPLLLQGPGTESNVALELQAHLERLRFDRPDVFASRLGEVVYLANVLMAGSWYQGGRFSEYDAAQAALACANLGLDFLLQEKQGSDASHRARAAEGLLDCAPGIVRLFQIGWRLIQAVPMRCATGLLERLRSDDVRKQLKRKQWILDEIESAVSDPDILALIEQGAFEDVGDNLVLLSLVLDVRACHALRTLIVDFPRYPIQLDLGFHPSQPSIKDDRYFTELRQLDQVDTFVDELDRLIKV